jgi:hypothetical protein
VKAEVIREATDPDRPWVIVHHPRWSRSGGEIFRWSDTPKSLRAALAEGVVSLFEPRPHSHPFVCQTCGRQFVSQRSCLTHSLDRHGVVARKNDLDPPNRRGGGDLEDRGTW